MTALRTFFAALLAASNVFVRGAYTAPWAPDGHHSRK